MRIRRISAGSRSRSRSIAVAVTTVAALAKLAVVITIGLSGCAEEHPTRRDSVTRTSAAVVSGALDGGDEAVVAIVPRRNDCAQAPPIPPCSGTLIAPRVVLTAAHCLDHTTSLEAYFGASATDGSGRYVVVLGTAVHPRYDRETHAFDVALLRLADDPGVKPVSMGALDASEVGQPARVVGFGVDGSSASIPGEKRQGVTKITTIDATSFDATPDPAMTCAGDSGGPVFVSSADAGGEILVGVTAAGDSACKVDALNVRVDAVRDFIDPFIAAAATSPVGMPASAIAPASLCAQRCTTAADCPAGLSCDPFNGGTCLLEGVSPSNFGDACSATVACPTTAHCARLWPSGPDACRCATLCDGAAPPPPIPSTSATATSEPSSTGSSGSSCGIGGVGVSSSRASLASLASVTLLGALVALAAKRIRRRTTRSTRPTARTAHRSPPPSERRR